MMLVQGVHMKLTKNKTKASKTPGQKPKKRTVKKLRTVGEHFGHGRHLWKSDADFKKFIDILNENSKR
jgi:hypothetical protein